MATNARLLAKAMVEAPVLTNIIESVDATVQSPINYPASFNVNSIDDLPLTGNNQGDQAFVGSNNRLYIWAGTGWYNIALLNTNPTIDSNSYDAAYTLDSHNGASTVIQLAATDPEGIPITWTYTASDSAQYFANIVQDSSLFTITALTTDSIGLYDASGGTFSVTFKASDGVNLATALSEFTISFTGPGELYGWFAGGYTPAARISQVDRIDYANDLVTTSIRGSLPTERQSPAATGNTMYGWYAGGYFPLVESSVYRIDYAADTGIASVRSPLSITRNSLAATGTENYGWFGGGYTPAGTSMVERIDYADDLVTPSTRGSLSLLRQDLAAAGNSNYGWFGGGFYGPVYSTVDRIDYVNDLSTASIRGPLSLAGKELAATGNADYGWFGSRWFPAPISSTIDRIDYAADTNIASVRGPLAIYGYNMAATGTVNYGWFAGGANPAPTPLNGITRIDYASDTNVSSLRGSLSTARRLMGATGGYPG